MTLLVLPNTIDAGTEITAAELQGNFVATRDLINGNIEGGAGSSGNIKANGVTAREIEDAVLDAYRRTALQAGVFDVTDLKVTPGAGLVLNYGAGLAWIKDSAGVVSTLGTSLIPVTNLAGGSVTIASNATGNPRIDQVILTLTAYNAGTVSVLQGTATAGATLDNRTGAAALPAGAIRLADILMPTGFAGPFVATTHIRDRRLWARGANAIGGDTSNRTRTTPFGVVTGTPAHRVELSGAPVTVRFTAANMSHNLASAVNIDFGILMDGTAVYSHRFYVAGSAQAVPVELHVALTGIAAGSHLFQVGLDSNNAGATVTLAGTATTPMVLQISEDVRAAANNGTA